VRDPLDPGNPYKGRYAAYDVWIYVQAYQQAQGQPADSGDLEDSAGMWYAMPVDEQGWPVPLKVDTEKYYSSGPTPDSEHSVCQRAVSVFGFMGNKLEAMQQADMLEGKARHLPLIPRWLTERLPQQAMVLRSGEVVTQGPADGLEHAADEAVASRYYRYSADGAELGNAPGPYWWQLYFPGFTALNERHKDSYWLEYQGYVTRYRQSDGAMQETYDYTGRRVDGQAAPRPRGDFEWLQRDSITELYTQQTGDFKYAGEAQGA
jgi:hypothetical protein